MDTNQYLPQYLHQLIESSGGHTKMGDGGCGPPRPPPPLPNGHGRRPRPRAVGVVDLRSKP